MTIANLSLITTFFRLPFSIQRKVLNHFVNRWLRLRSTDHQIIWTSFFYFISAGFIKIVEHPQFYNVHLPTGMQVHLRKGKSSDIFVFFQVFIRKEYDPLFTFIKKQNVRIETIVDAGANIGLFSLEATHHFPDAAIQAVEPEKSNYDLLEEHIRCNNLNQSVRTIECALWVRNAKLSLIADNHWSTRVSESDSNTGEFILGMPLSELLQRSGCAHIDLLKLDVEGTEMQLFNDDNFVSLLGNIKLLAMEIHDSMADREYITETLRRHGFKYFDSGEMTVAWNTSFIKAI
jgi:FkbM family methyltransferase